MNEPNGVDICDKWKDVPTIKGTKDLLDRYPDRFEKKRDGNSVYYIEKPTESNKNRGRYIAIEIERLSNEKLPNPQNLTCVTGDNVWGRDFSSGELMSVSGAVASIKLAGEQNMDQSHLARMRDFSTVNVEYIPYLPENTAKVVDDLDIAE